MTLTINSLLDGPVESIECLDTDFTVVVSVRTALEEELDQRRDVRAKDGTFENKEGLEDIEQLTGSLLIISLNTLANNVDHGRKVPLERFL